jgi:hypothetical protein
MFFMQSHILVIRVIQPAQIETKAVSILSFFTGEFKLRVQR